MFEALGYTGKANPMIQQTNIQINTIESALDGLEGVEERAGVSFSSIRRIEAAKPVNAEVIDAEIVG